jgi:hypothetical protein
MIEIIRTHPVGALLAALLLLSLLFLAYQIIGAGLQFAIWATPKLDAWAWRVIASIRS